MPAVPELEAVEIEEESIEPGEPPPYDTAEEVARLMAERRASWAPLANCWELSTSDLFPSSVVKEAAAANKVCGGCPVMHDCLMLAMIRRESFGVWGGRTSRELNAVYKLIAQEYGDIWRQFDDSSGDIMYKYASDLCDDYDEKHGINRDEVEHTRLDRLNSMQERLANLRL